MERRLCSERIICIILCIIIMLLLDTFIIGSTDYMVEAIAPFYPKVEIVPDDYGMSSVRANLSQLYNVRGALICRHDFIESFSILLKIKAEPKTPYFTLLNITNNDDDQTAFSIVVDIRKSRVVVYFKNCLTVQLSFHPSDDFTDGRYHRLALAIDPRYISLFTDCKEASKHNLPHNCRVPCSEDVTVRALQNSSGPGTVRTLIFKKDYILQVLNMFSILCT